MDRNDAQQKPKATTKDIVGDSTGLKPVPPKWKPYYDRLIDLRDYLLKRQVALAKNAIEESPTLGTHIADAGTDTYDRDFALSMLSSEQEALYEVEQAIDRIRNGTYGVCELTGKPIDPARLQAIPWTRFSLEAEKQLEAEGCAKTMRLGTRETVAKVEAEESSQERG